jgi:hypothetical protein
MEHQVDKTEERLCLDLGLKRLRYGWAKAELFLGLSAAGLGVWLLGIDAPAYVPLVGGVLFVLGLYLAMAGHRSHIYMSNTKLAAYVISSWGDGDSAPRVSVIGNSRGGDPQDSGS